MRKLIHFFGSNLKWSFFAGLFLLSALVWAQPQHAYNPATGKAFNTIPFNSSAAGSNRRQVLFYPSDFNSQGAGLITKIYFQASATVNPNMSNVQIYMGTTNLTALTAGPFVTGLTQVLLAPTFTATALPDNWIAFTLQTPFLWDMTSNLIVDAQQNGFSTGFSLNVTTTLGRSLFGNAQAATATAQDRLAVFGFDVVPAGPCTSPPVVGATTTNVNQVCVNGTVSLGLDTLTYGTGQSFQWQYATDSITWVNMTNDTLMYLSTSVPTTRWYRCQVTCGANTVSSQPVKIIALGIPLSAGTYTINSGVPTGGSNFISFSDFKNAVVCGGVSGPVIIQVTPNAAGYNEQIYLGNIMGTSATNTITIQGNGAVLSNVGATANRGTLTLDGTSYITFKNLTIEGLGLINSYGVELRNDANHIVFDSCTVRGNLAATGSNTGAFICSNNPISPTAAGLAASNLTVTHCLIEGGYYAFILNGPTTAPWSANNVIENNEIRDFYQYGMYIRGQENSSFKNNDIHRMNKMAISSFYGIYVLSGVAGTQFVGNRIHNTNDNGSSSTTNYAIYASGAMGTAANPATFANNVIYNFNNTGSLYCLYVPSGDHLRFYHNTINLNSAATSGLTGVIRAVYFLASSGTFEFKNNIVSLDIQGVGAKHLLYLSNTAPTYDFSNNQYNFTSTGGTNTFGYYGADVGNLTAWKALRNGTLDQNSVYGDAVFNTSDFFTPQTVVGNAAGTNLLTEVPTDIFGAARTTTPDIGAVEFTPLTCLQPIAFSGISSSTSITINWTNDPDADSVRIEYGLSGFNQGTGTGVNVSGSTFTANGLLSQMCYDFYVYTWCNGVAGNGTTFFTYCTKCGAKPIPLLENFDGGSGGAVSSIPNTPTCWYYFKSGALTSVYGYNYSGQSPRSTPYHWRMYNGSNTTDTVALISPAIDGLILGDKRVRFWTKSNAVLPTRVVVGTVVGPDQMHTFAPIDTFDAPQGYTEFTQTFNTVTGYNGTDAYVVFMMQNTASGQSLYLDDISFELVPTCAVPIAVNSTAITGTSAGITWGSVSGTCFRIEYGLAGFSQGSGQGIIINNATSPQTISGLLPNTAYDVYVFDCCNYSLVSQIHSFKTACVAPLVGNYTINKNATASATNFVSITSFAASLENCGISGAVVANVVAGTGPYNEHILLTAVSGASAINTITLNGNGNELTFVSVDEGQRATLTFDGASFFIVKNLSIFGTGMVSSYAIEYRNGTHDVALDNCVVVTSKVATVSSVNTIVFSDNSISPTAVSGVFYNNTIKNSIIEGGYYGLVLNGPAAAPWSTNNILENNEIRDFYFYGVWVRGQQNSIIRGNNINRATRTAISSLYGLYVSGASEGLKITENRVHNVADSAQNTNFASYPYYFTSATGTAANPIIFANNLMYNINTTSLIYGVYVAGVSDHIKMYHNTLSLENFGSGTSTQRTLFIGSVSGNFDIKNNIFNLTSGSTGAKYLVYFTSMLPNFVLNNNQYYINGAGASTNNSVGYWGSIFNTFTAWQGANSSSFEVNGVYGNPGFTALAAGNLTPTGQYGNSAGQNLLSQVPLDYYGVARTTTPDIGAIEFTPVTADILLASAQLSKGQCLSTADTVNLVITNIAGAMIDFATNPLNANWTLTGPVNSGGTIVKNSGTMPASGSIGLSAYTANLSVPGTYTLKAWIAPNAINLLANNDTISNVVFNVLPLFSATPQTAAVGTASDSVQISVTSPFFAGKNFFITEVCQMRTTLGIPVTNWPAYLLADDYIEITGVPGSDLGDITLEQWSATTLLGSYTFPAGTVLSPAGTAIIAVGQLGASVASPANYYYHGNGSYSGSFGGADATGRVLKSGNTIIDAVGYSGFVFPTTSGVTAADWSNSLIGGNGTIGIRLQGPDVNSGTNWVIASSSAPQNPNAVNTNVTLPSPQSIAGFSWSLNGTVIDTNVKIYVGPWASSGVYYYVATLLNSPCGTLTDTVVITVTLPAACLAPVFTFASATNCTQTTLNWSSAATKLSSKIEYGPTGFTPGTGTVISGATSPQLITGLTMATGYDFRIIDSCATGLSASAKVTVTTASGPLPIAGGVFTVISVTSFSSDVQFNGNTSANYTTLTWDFGDLSPTVTGVNPLHSYLANGTYTVTITAVGPCGTDVATLTVIISGIGVDENGILNALEIYPNPSKGNFNVNLITEYATGITIRVVSLQGQILYSQNFGTVQGGFNETIGLENAAAGVYLLQITTNKGIVTQRITLYK